MEVFIIIPIVIVVILFWWVGTKNQFKVLEVKIEESDSDIDVALVKRFDTLTKLLDVTKGYAKHEADTLLELVMVRKGMSLNQKKNASEEMDQAADKINLIAENYPELKSSENFIELQKAVVEVEEHLQAARRLYNSNVSFFNQMIVVFPKSMVASSMQLQEKPFFEAEALKREDVKMEF